MGDRGNEYAVKLMNELGWFPYLAYREIEIGEIIISETLPKRQTIIGKMSEGEIELALRTMKRLNIPILRENEIRNGIAINYKAMVD